MVEAIETSLREDRIKADCSDLFSHVKIELLTAQLADLKLIRGGAMSIHARIAMQIDPNDWAHVYGHFDDYSAHMLPALVRWKP